jgi:hypothetical protein
MRWRGGVDGMLAHDSGGQRFKSHRSPKKIILPLFSPFFEYSQVLYLTMPIRFRTMMKGR